MTDSISRASQTMARCVRAVKDDDERSAEVGGTAIGEIYYCIYAFNYAFHR